MKTEKVEWTPIVRKYPTNPKEIYTGVGVKSDTKHGAYFTVICDMILPNGDDEYILQHEKIKANAILISEAPETKAKLQKAEAQRDELATGLITVIAILNDEQKKEYPAICEMAKIAIKSIEEND